MVWRELANRIGGRGVSSECEGLAAAATEIPVAEFATAARIPHPVDTAKTLEGVVVVPYPLQCALTH